MAIKCCIDCSRKATIWGWTCGVYGVPPSYYVRVGSCPFNQKEAEAAKVKVRVGQQKQKKKKGE